MIDNSSEQPDKSTPGFFERVTGIFGRTKDAKTAGEDIGEDSEEETGASLTGFDFITVRVKYRSMNKAGQFLPSPHTISGVRYRLYSANTRLSRTPKLPQIPHKIDAGIENTS